MPEPSLLNASEAPKPVPAADLHPSSLGHALRAFWNLLLEKLWIMAFCLVAAVLLSAAYLRRAPVLYSATATLQVEQQEQPIVAMDKMQWEDLRGLDVIQTIAATLKSRTLLERVMDTNKLASDPRFVNLLAGTPSREQLFKMLNAMIDVRLRRGTRLIDITAVHPAPDLTEKLANSLLAEFMRENVERHTDTSGKASEFLIEGAHRLKLKLQESENALQAYREKTGAVSLNERQDTVVAKLKELSTRATEAKSVRIRAETSWAQIQALGSNVQALLTLPVVAVDPKVVEIQLTINKLESDFANLRQRYKEKHPKYIQAVSQLEEWRDTFTNTVLNVPQTVKSLLANAQAAEKALEEALRAQEAAALKLNELSIQYNVLAREVESDRALYESVLNRMKETAVTLKKEEVQPVKVRVVQKAYLPEAPFFPNRVHILTRGLVAGLLAGLMFAIAMTALDSSFKSVDQAEEFLHKPVLAAVPQVRRVKEGKGMLLLLAEQAKSAGAEAFRTLRTSLSMLGRAEDRRVFLFTSSLPQEGKTFCSLNYAVSLAQQGLRTIMVDADLRRPSIGNVLSENGAAGPGVTDYLAGQKTFEEIVQPSTVANLSYIAGGTTAPNPAELLAQGRFAEVIQKALERADRVVIDTAPIHAVSDTLLILPHVQTVCVVARANKTPRRAVQRCLALLEGTGAPVAGVVLNRMARRSRDGYYYDPYYNYSYYGKYARKGVYGAK